MADDQHILPEDISPEEHTFREREDRIQKLKDITAMGIQPYPGKFEKNHVIAKLLRIGEDENALKTVEEIELNKPNTYQTAGRIIMKRTHGKLSFTHLLDDTGKIQLAFMQNLLGQEQYEFFLNYIDLGDFIGVHGELFRTNHGEISLLVTAFTFLGKALRPLPDKFHGLSDPETIYRQRYLDLISNQESKKRFQFRSNFIRKLREFYWSKGFYEVECATFLETATGAAANPYRTHHDALDIDMVLRISHELPLKKLIVGGFERVFELGKVFRNEGIDPSHLPEHTHLEHYVAYWNFEDNITFTEEMFDYLFKELQLNTIISIPDKHGVFNDINFQTPWPRVDYVELIKKDTGIDIRTLTTADQLITLLEEKQMNIEGMHHMGLTTLIDHVYKKHSRPKLINPTILYNYPIAMQPLARKNDNDPKMVDQFQLVINGWEVLKAYSELVDPIDQEERFIEQAKAKAGGDVEAMDMEEDYIIAMEHGMPPISGWGMGVDRIITLLSGQQNLRDVVLFPLMRPKK